MIPRSIARKILLVGPDYRDHRGGIGAVIGWHREQYEVFNFIPSFRPFRYTWRKSWYFFCQLIRIGTELACNPEIEIVHIHSSKQGSLYRKLLVTCLARFIFRKKTINHIHTGNLQRFYENSHPLGRKLIAWYLRLHDATITVSDALKTYCETTFGLRSVYKINNMIGGPPRLTIEPMARNGCVHLLYLGLIDRHKGIFDVIEVLAENRELLLGKIRLFVGGNGQVDTLRRLIDAKQLDELVEYKGWVTGPQKHALWQHADVFVLPSYYEGIPMAILEAMQYGKPVIATRVGGIPELVQHGSSGYLINPGDHSALLESIMFYVNGRENIGTHGAKAAGMVRNYLPEKIMPQLEHIYLSLL